MHEGSSRADDQLGIKFSASLMLAWIGGFIPLESGPIWIPAARMHFGVTGVVIGLVASHMGGSVLEMGLSIASVTLGLLLGVFLLGWNMSSFTSRLWGGKTPIVSD